MSDLDQLRALLGRLPPRPWRWQQVTPAPHRHDPDPRPGGVALVAADGTWLAWAEGGYGSVEVAGGTGSDVGRVLAAAADVLDARSAPAGDPFRWRTTATELLVDEAASYLYSGVPTVPPWAVVNELCRRLTLAEERLEELGVSLDEAATRPDGAGH